MGVKPGFTLRKYWKGCPKNKVLKRIFWHT